MRNRSQCFSRSDHGDEMVMIFRVKDNKVVDAWDLHVPLKVDSAVFSGLDR